MARMPSAGFLVAVALATLSCNAFRRTAGPEDAGQVNPPGTISVTVEYEQIVECVAGSPRCEDNVAFFGSWGTPGQEFFLTKQPGRYIWRGTATSVPVNYPPKNTTSGPYLVRIFDPHIVGEPTGGITAARLKVGGEAIVRFDQPGTPYESGLVYIDENGQGHTPY